MYNYLEEQREEFFNFKDDQGLIKFNELTNTGDKLSQCFENDENIDEQMKKWNKKMISILYVFVHYLL